MNFGLYHGRNFDDRYKDREQRHEDSCSAESRSHVELSPFVFKAPLAGMDALTFIDGDDHQDVL
jgi:hypothetical protein